MIYWRVYLRSFDAQLFHAGFQRCRINVQDPGGALFPANFPVDLVHHINNVLALDVA